MTPIKQTGGWQRTGITAVLQIFEQKFPPYITEYFELLALFQRFYLFTCTTISR
jgi:hypothetical protein